MPKSDDLRRALREKPILRVGGAFDALSAKLVEIYGFDAIWAGSFAISATHALPDASILTMTEFLNVAANMAETCNIPVIADCDTGFGGPSNVSHLVKKYEKAGIAGISIKTRLFQNKTVCLRMVRMNFYQKKILLQKLLLLEIPKKIKIF